MTPDCEQRRHWWSVTYDIVNMRRVFQHGKNQEAVLLVDDYDLVRAEGDPERWLREHVGEWVGRVHEYDAAQQPGSDARGDGE